MSKNKQIKHTIDIHLDCDKDMNVLSMSVIQDSGNKINILSSQNVGINMSNPTAKLHVEETADNVGIGGEVRG